ncbi:MAG: HEAT repeat domain-containing protein [Deltaproteobacteria bacterium]|nr:HEAT repeat domain-containing protein [Deltaproteobacteria bacterium]
MTGQGASGVFHAALVRVAAIAAVLLILFRTEYAHADAVDSLIGQLESSSDKVRLSSALNLTKLGDAKAILPLAKALGNDSDKNVRSAAAVGLGKLITPSTKANIKKLAMNALTKAAADDSSEFVKAQAEKALKALGGSAPPPDTGSGKSGGGGGIYVNIGPMSSKTGNAAQDPKLRTLMNKVATKTMGRAPHMPTTWAGGSVPTKGQLQSKNVDGFYVDGTLNEVKVTTSGSTSIVSCKVSMLLASFPDKSVFGFLNGGAKVQGSSSQRDIDLGMEDCVSAVMEDLIAKKIIPTICTKATCP